MRFLLPNSISLEADGGQRRCLEADQIGHLHSQPRRRIDDAGQNIRIFKGLGIVAGAVRVHLWSWRQGASAIGDPRKSYCITLFGCRRLVATIVGRARDDDPTHPFDDFLPLGERQAAEIIRKMPCKSSPLSSADVAISWSYRERDWCGSFALKYPCASR